MVKLKYDQRYYTFLDGLREIGVVNMFASSPHLSVVFPELDGSLARKVLVDWMKTFSERKEKKPKIVAVPGNINDEEDWAKWLHRKKRRK